MDPSIYDFYEPSETAIAAGMLSVMIVVYAVAFILVIAQYVMNAIALMKMAKKVGVPNGWMGFIPVAETYLLGRIADVSAPKKNNAKRLLIAISVFFGCLVLYMVVIFGAAFSGILSGEMTTAWVIWMLVGMLVYFAAAIVYSVFFYIAWYRICENFGGTSSVGYFLGMLLGGMFCSSLIPVILSLVLSSKTPAVTENGVTVTPPPPPTDSVFQ